MIAWRQIWLESQKTDQSGASIEDQYNWEAPLLTGRAIAALASDPAVINRTGRVQIVAELAERYGLVDQDGNRPASLRSLRFLLPSAVPTSRQYARLLLDIKMPWSLLLITMLRAPKISAARIQV